MRFGFERRDPSGLFELAELYLKDLKNTNKNQCVLGFWDSARLRLGDYFIL
jgi:hypothetical protein